MKRMVAQAGARFFRKQRTSDWAVGTFKSIAIAGCLSFMQLSASASIAYGSINNFDTVNDTGVECHGFEIELDDIRSTDISYTYDYNHYGTPKITEDTLSVPGHTNVIVRYEAVWTNSGWSAYTAVPTNSIPPTQGHAFTNPSLNFGGEHFGVGYQNPPTKVYYYWLTNSGGSLVRGPQVNVSTPVFTPGAVAGQVVPIIPAPLLPVAPPPLIDPTLVYEFSDATWVKVIATTSHTNHAIELRELITPDLDNPGAKDWRNGEPDEVETEWQLLQTDFNSSAYNPTNGVGGANGQLIGKAKSIASDDVVTYRYEYYAYAGPYADWDTHEALAQNVAADGVHGVGTYLDQNGDPVDLSTTAVVGNFLGAQMSAMAAAPPVGLIDHLPDAEVDTLYPTRSVIIAGNVTNFTATCSGLPDGMSFDAVNGWVGNTPTSDGIFIVTVSVTVSNGPVLTKNYPLLVTAAGAVWPPHSSVNTTVAPANGGTASGDGVYTNDTTATVTATPNPGFRFLNWTENGVVVSASANYTFTNIINQSLVANFVPAPTLTVLNQAGSLVLSWPTNFSGFSLQQNLDLNTPNWEIPVEGFIPVGTNYQAIISTTTGTRFFRLVH